MIVTPCAEQPFLGAQATQASQIERTEYDHLWDMWQVSPHEFMRAVMAASNGRITINTQGDPVDFWIWFVNTLRADLHATPGAKHKKSMLTKGFQVMPAVLCLARVCL